MSAFSCGPVDPPPTSPVPQNACPCAGTDAAGAITSCVAGLCARATAIDPVLVFDFTDAASFAATLQYAVRYSDLVAASAKGKTACTAANALCARIPNPLAEDGFYAANAALQEVVGMPVAAARDTTNITVPVHVQYRPQWQFGVATTPPTYLDAAYFGLPLRTLTAGLESPAALHGPFGAAPVGWQGSFFPGVYQRVIAPDTPFDAAYPPLVIDAQLLTTNTRYEQTPIVDPPSAEKRDLVMARAGADPSLEGWTVYVRDKISSNRISELVTLHGAAPPSFHLNTVGRPSIGNQLLVVTPRLGSVALPTLIDTVPPVGFLKVETYPALPPPTVVRGVVRGPSSELVEADVLFVDAGGTRGSLVTSDPNDATRPFLHYRTRVHATAGAFTVPLPPGEYSAFVVPSSDTTLATTSMAVIIPAPGTVDLDGGAPVVPDGGDASTTAGGPADASGGPSAEAPATVPLLLGAVARVGVRGLAVAPGNRPLAGATVEARPSVSLLATQVDPETWPRSQTTFTDDSGAYALALDPGVYDLIIEPSPGSGFPWSLLPVRSIAGDRVDLGTVSVPFPNLLSLQLQGGNDRVLERVLVRAYLPVGSPLLAAAAASDGTPGRADGTESPFIQVGSTLAGSDGLVQLFLTSPN